MSRVRSSSSSAGPLKNSPFELTGSEERAVLLVHGLSGGPFEVQRIAEHLHTTLNLSCQAIHLPGHERPTPIMPNSRWEDWYAHVERSYLDLTQRFSRVDVIGFSTGCPLLLNLAQGHGICGRLVLLAPFVRVFKPKISPVRAEAVLEGMQKVPLLGELSVVPSLTPPLKNRAMRAEVKRAAHLKTMNLNAARSALELIRRVMDKLEQVDVPTLIIQGERDSVVDPQGARDLCEGLVCERQLHMLERSDHLLALDEERDQVFAHIQAFLEPASAISGL